MPETADFSEQQIDRNKLLAALIDGFGENDLRSLCFELGIDYDHFPPGGTADKARELALRCERERRLPELAEAVLIARPNIPRHSLIRDTHTDQSPFKGLPAFQEEDEAIFYGRETLTTELLHRLLAPSPSQGEGKGEGKFLALVGASGSGKSSVVRAGLIPALRRQTDWPIHLITPTAHPLETLAVTLTKESESVTAVTTLLDDLRRDPRSLHFYVRRLLSREAEQTSPHLPTASSPHLLLVIDQFEELFTLCRDEAEKRAFVENLVVAVQPETAGPTLVILILRADFYSHCLQFESLHRLLEQRQKIVPAMNTAELREAIEHPASRAGLVFEAGLVDLLLRDIGATGSQSLEPGALPLLSHALLETWQRREGHRLTLAGYTEAGGVHGAIAKTAESTYQRLTPEQQTIAHNIFLRLTELGEGTQDTRRRANLGELLPRTAEPAAVEVVLKLLTDARLVTTDEDAAEVAHEALIREWPTLRRWLDEDREGLRIHRQLTEDAAKWEKTARDVNYLYRGGRLAQAREWAARPDADLNELEQTFLDAGLVQQQDELATAKATAAREADAARKLRQRAVFLRGALVIAAALAIVSFLLYRQARVQAQSSQSVALAAASQAVGNDQAMRSLLLAIEAGAVEATTLAFTAINQRLPVMARPQQTLGHESGVTGAEWNGDESQILTWGCDEENVFGCKSGTVVVWDAASGARQQTLGHEGRVSGAVWNEDESQILTWNWDGTAGVWDAASGERLQTLGHEGGVTGAAWNGDESQILTWGCDEEIDFSCKSGTAVVWDVASGQRLQTLSHETLVFGAAWNEDESQILTWSDDGTAGVWDAVSGQRLQTLSHETSVFGAAWNGEGSQILTWSRDGTARVWDAVSGQRLQTLSHKDEGWSGVYVKGAMWNGDESQILTWSGDTLGEGGTAVVWDAVSGQPLQTVSHEGAVTGAMWNGDESQILTWSDDGTAGVWDVASGQGLQTLGHEGGVTGAAWNGDESQILTWNWDGTAGVWDAASGERLQTLNHGSWVTGAAWNGDESQILTWSEDGTAVVWDAVSGERLQTLRHEGRVSGAAWNGDESRILTWSNDETARVWDFANDKALMTLEGDGTLVVLVQWNRDESRILLVTQGRYARLYYTDMAELLAVACQYATRNLNGTEWQLYLPGQPYRQTCPNLPRHPSVPPDG